MKSNVDARIGENVSVESTGSACCEPVVPIAADINDAIETFPNGANPAGCTAFFSSFMNVAVD